MWDYRQNFSIQQTEISCKLDKTNIEFLLPENLINSRQRYARICQRQNNHIYNKL